jgi:hypothetical protein
VGPLSLFEPEDSAGRRVKYSCIHVHGCGCHELLIMLGRVIAGCPIDGNRWSEKRSINRYQSIKLVNWYRLVSVNRWSIDHHTKTVHRLLSIGTAISNRPHACYLSDHPPFLGSPGYEIGKTIPTQSSQRKEYTLLHVYSNCPLACHCLSVSLCLRMKSGKRLYWI